MSDKYVVEYDSVAGLQYIAPGNVPTPIAFAGGLGVIPVGLVGDGVAHDDVAIQTAINTGHNVLLPKPAVSYLCATTLTTAVAGQEIIGENAYYTSITTLAGSTYDILRVKHYRCSVKSLMFKPATVNNLCLRLYGGQALIENCMALSSTNLQGTWLLETEIDPVSGAIIAGAYVNTIQRNHIGEYGNSFEWGIDTNSPTNGQNANYLHNNHFICVNPIRNTNGGGETYAANLFQQPTSLGVPASGIALDFSASTFNQHAYGNYFEDFTQPILSRTTSNTYRSVTAIANNFDACTTNLVVTDGSTNFIDDQVAAAGGGATPVTWTPSDGNGSLVFSEALGTGVKIPISGGKFLYILQFAVKYPTNSSTNHATVGGFPDTVGSTNIGGFAPSYISGGALVTLQANIGATTASMYNVSGGNVTGANVSNSFINGVIIFNN